MKPIQFYNKETVSKLKRWISDVQARGHQQYYEIFVDEIKVIHKTNDTAEFESHLNWIDEETQVVKVLTYNTKGSHRSKVFEFRTNKYVDKVNYKDKVEILESTNGDLLKKIADAEENIHNLETQLEQQTKKPAFDIESIISKFGAAAQQNPDLARNFDGIAKSKNDREMGGTCEVSFKKNSTNVDLISEDMISFSTSATLSEEETKRMTELMQFFAKNPAYISVVYELVNQENEKFRT